MTRTILLANPRGFCAGVDRAIDIVDQLLDLHGGPLYVRKEIVHNRDVVEGFQRRGVVFVDEIDQVPDGALAVFSAHGIAPEVRRLAAERGLRVVDATCPLVSKVHLEAIRFAKQGLFVLLVGHKGHDEVAGTLGEIPDRIALVENVRDAQTVAVPDPKAVAVVTQTTLSLDDTREILQALRERFPTLHEPAKSDICYATQNRQTAVKDLARVADLIVVVGSQNSSNSQRLRESAEQMGTPAHLVDREEDVEAAWFDGVATVGITAGASSPETLVRRIVERVRAFGDFTIEDFGTREPAIVFAPPRELAELRPA